MLDLSQLPIGGPELHSKRLCRYPTWS